MVASQKAATDNGNHGDGDTGRDRGNGKKQDDQYGNKNAEHATASRAFDYCFRIDFWC